ncbi:TetR family transcriptional regulator [Octadecabacter arcticus 238]|uniref:TetR family transcriptional regulator n=1 Tax=Octadecabacter arcticus 238 TaxID=391616 RepID=M9REM1_9RHOB|nr:TetR/AcrR family transcriptional regulator [Octadecabacter arcticus]AGI71029.1 TetR family transcriptional regulator [Octadecabacter arcticus 238]
MTKNIDSNKPQTRPRRPGRPAGDKDLRVDILDSAEQVFSEHGYNGSRMRDIASRCNVNQALINYYFQSKQHLFDQVFLRRGKHIGRRREELLDALIADPTAPSVEALVRAYLTPQWDMKYSGEAGAAFVKLQARLHAEPEDHALRLRREVYDRSAKRYIVALCEALPHVSQRTVGLRMAFLIGAYLFMLNDVDRLNDLTDNQLGKVNKLEMLNNLVIFLSSGMTAPDHTPIP